MILKPLSIIFLALTLPQTGFSEGVEILTDNYATFQRVCVADNKSLIFEDVDQNGNYKERSDNQTCNLIAPQGSKLYPYDDIQYKISVNWVTPNEEDSWDELALFYNNSTLKFGDQGMPYWSWDGFTLLKDSKGVFALIAKRSAFNEKDHQHFVIYMNKEKSCRIQVPPSKGFQNLMAFKDKNQALEAAMKLQSRKNISCERRMEMI